MNVLIDYNIVLVEKSGRKKLYHVNHELKLVSILWELFMEEKKKNINPDFKNTIDLLFNQIKEDVELFILFGKFGSGTGHPEK